MKGQISTWLRFFSCKTEQMESPRGLKVCQEGAWSDPWIGATSSHLRLPATLRKKTACPQSGPS